MNIENGRIKTFHPLAIPPFILRAIITDVDSFLAGADHPLGSFQVPATASDGSLVAGKVALILFGILVHGPHYHLAVMGARKELMLGGPVQG